MNDSIVERTVTALAKRKGWISVKLSRGHGRVYMCNGVATFLVFGEPDATQTKAIAKFRDAGFRATWVTNFADGKHFLTNR